MRLSLNTPLNDTFGSKVNLTARGPEDPYAPIMPSSSHLDLFTPKLLNEDSHVIIEESVEEESRELKWYERG